MSSAREAEVSRLDAGSPRGLLSCPAVRFRIAKWKLQGQICSGTMSMAPHGHSCAQIPHPLQ